MVRPYLGQFALFLQFKAKDEMFDDFRVENLDESCKIRFQAIKVFHGPDYDGVSVIHRGEFFKIREFEILVKYGTNL